MGSRFARLYNPTALCGRRRDGELRTSRGSSKQRPRWKAVVGWEQAGSKGRTYGSEKGSLEGGRNEDGEGGGKDGME